MRRMNEYEAELQSITRQVEKLARTYSTNTDNVLWEIKTLSMRNGWRTKAQTKIGEYIECQ